MLCSCQWHYKYFSMCSPVVKATLFRTFCSNMYCSQLWRDFRSGFIRQLIVGYNLTTLETRRLRGDQIEVFKILNGYGNIDSNIFFEIKESKITRGHNYTLVKKQSRLDVRKYSFSQRTINVWNNLSTDCVHASSVNMFKNKIDKLRRAIHRISAG